MYLVGTIVSSVAPTPGGIGVVEATLIAGLTSAGMPSATAVAAVLLFRIVTFWLPLLPGWAAVRAPAAVRRRLTGVEGVEISQGAAVLTDVVPANGIQIAYDAFGNRADPAVILVMGLATQRLAWARRVLRGRSPAPDGSWSGSTTATRASRRTSTSTANRRSSTCVRRRPPPYRIDDMADDVIGLIDALGLGTVHVVGASMGGFIAQTVAIRYPHRVHTLTLVMTSTGSVRVGRPGSRVSCSASCGGGPRPIGRRRSRRRSARSGVIGSPGFPTDEDRLRRARGRELRPRVRPGRLRSASSPRSSPSRTGPRGCAG